MPKIITQLQDFLIQSALADPDKIALIAGKKSFTYREIHESSNALANCFLEMGVKRGDRIVVHLGNCVEAVIAFWAVLKANAVVSWISPDLKADKIAYILQDSGAKIFITDHLKNTEINYKVFNFLKNIITVADDFHIYISTGDRQQPPVCENLTIDLASILYTSGSTGEPKGVMLTHSNMLSAAYSVNAYLENKKTDIIACVLPLSFDYGLYQMIMIFSVGGTLVLEKDLLWPTQLLKIIEREKVTALPIVPTVISLLQEHSNYTHFDLSSIRYVSNTGAALSVKHIDYIKYIFPAAKIYSMYGLTECKRCTYLPPRDIDRKPYSVGIAIPNTEMWIVNEEDDKLAPHQVGQLVIRGATVMKGYWNKPLETAQKLRPGPLPFEQVLYTGDYCSLDEEGYLYFHGRMDEVIKNRGIKISPKEIEDTLITLPGIKEVAVIGAQDEEMGDAIHIYVAHETPGVVTVDYIMDFCKKRLEHTKWPQRIFILAGLPKTANGKINKRALKATCEIA